MPGVKGHVWLPAEKEGLWRTTDGGKTFTQIDSTIVQWADVIGFGKAAPGSDYPAIYITGKVSGKTGVFMSKDQGASWIRINDDRHQYGSINYAITGDMRKYGIVFVGTNGRGVVYGDISLPNSTRLVQMISLPQRIFREGTIVYAFGKDNLSLFDLKGTLLFTGHSNGTKAHIDLSKCAKGTYIARFGREIMRTVIQK